VDDGNIFAELMNAVHCCSLGQISNAFFAVRASMGTTYERSRSGGSALVHDAAEQQTCVGLVGESQRLPADPGSAM
jgi:hypothetical protein